MYSVHNRLLSWGLQVVLIQNGPEEKLECTQLRKEHHVQTERLP